MMAIASSSLVVLVAGFIIFCYLAAQFFENHFVVLGCKGCGENLFVRNGKEARKAGEEFRSHVAELLCLNKKCQHYRVGFVISCRNLAHDGTYSSHFHKAVSVKKRQEMLFLAGKKIVTRSSIFG